MNPHFVFDDGARKELIMPFRFPCDPTGRHSGPTGRHIGPTGRHIGPIARHKKPRNRMSKFIPLKTFYVRFRFVPRVLCSFLFCHDPLCRSRKDQTPYKSICFCDDGSRKELIMPFRFPFDLTGTHIGPNRSHKNPRKRMSKFISVETYYISTC